MTSDNDLVVSSLASIKPADYSDVDVVCVAVGCEVRLIKNVNVAAGLVTAHRGQGHTWKNRLLSVDLGLESPSDRVPPDVGSLIYVACTRVKELEATPLL